MKRLLTIFTILSVLCLFSCQKSEDDSVQSDIAVTLRMSMEHYKELTYARSSHIWNETDRVLMLDAGQDGVSATSGAITPGAASSLFIYSMPIKDKESTLVGIYPANVPVTLGAGCLSFTIPQSQNGSLAEMQAGKTSYIKGSYSGAAMVLKPLYKVLNVWVERSNHIISSVKVTGKNGEMISGNVTLDIGTWTSSAVSSSVTVTLDNPLSCEKARQSVPVMVADTECEDYVAEITTVDGDRFTTENVVEGYVKEKELSYELGISQALFGGLSATEAKSMVNAGVKHIEVTMNTFWRNHTDEECYSLARSTRKLIDETPGLEVWSVHLPFSSTLDISVKDANARAENVDIMSKMIRLAGEFKPRKLVLHPSSEPISDADRATRLDNARESIGKLLPVAKEIGAQLCIENLPRTCLGRTSSEIWFLIQDYPEVMVCFDSNHLLIEDHNLFFQNVGHRIGTIHASDYDKVDERHWLPGLGVIDWPLFLLNLMHFGYEGVFMTEVKTGTAAEVVNAYKNVICK